MVVLPPTADYIEVVKFFKAIYPMYTFVGRDYDTKEYVLVRPLDLDAKRINYTAWYIYVDGKMMCIAW